MERIQSFLHWSLLVTLSSHVFCCVLPTVVSLAGLAAGLGVTSGMLEGLSTLHEALHHAERPLLAFSAVMLATGWSVYLYSRKIDCHNTGCVHAPCAPRKKCAGGILALATALFALNAGTLFFYG
ncbi:MAG: hypothetical protein KDJ15_03005 [Alphaproteobacteria bacterium]|nr:hypothetical protein [Alphaproteobacteria bacterium]